jgi:2-polyprenyl-6-methoxyphenol hydroxylase-like FAD-dependent oxidoreductase
MTFSITEKNIVPNMIVERYPQRLGAPKAHALSPRSLEICRQANLDVKKIRSLGTQRRDAYTVNFVRSLSGERVGYLPYERMDPAVLDATPEMIHNIPQPDYEQFMTEQLIGNQYTEIRKGVSFVSLSQNESKGEVTTVVEERDSGRQYAVVSRHVIACDGARSKVRTFLGIDSEGEDTLDTMMTIHFNANLRPIIKERVGMLHWIMDRDVSGFIIGYSLSDNQVLICNFDSKKHPADSWDEAQCRRIVDKALGQPTKYDILGFRPWTLSRKVAKEYQVGNVFLAGDAAHSFPPTGGLGLNSGLGDVHNIAYKLAGVHQGWASDAIMLSYKADRHMVALINSQQSVKNGQTIFKLLKMGSLPKRKTIPRSRIRKLQERKKQKLIQEGIAGQREHFDNVSLYP